VTERVTIAGVDQVVSSLDAAAGHLGDLSATNRQVADMGAAAARAAAPRLTGALAASTVGFADKTEAAVQSDLIYAPPIHNGWFAHNISPQPYISRAVDSLQGTFVAVYDRQVNDIADSVRGV
jgi:hypothetical protein